jgi:glutaminase
MTTDAAPSAPYVSTGNLPPAEHVRLLVNEAYERFRANAEGELSHVDPSLTTVDPDRFGICVADTRGLTAKAGDADVEFSIMSVAKPFVFALMCGVHTPNAVAHFCRSRREGQKGSTPWAPSKTTSTAGPIRWLIPGNCHDEHGSRRQRGRKVAFHP